WRVEGRLAVVVRGHAAVEVLVVLEGRVRVRDPTVLDIAGTDRVAIFGAGLGERTGLVADVAGAVRDAFERRVVHDAADLRHEASNVIPFVGGTIVTLRVAGRTERGLAATGCLVVLAAVEVAVRELTPGRDRAAVARVVGIADLELVGGAVARGSTGVVEALVDTVALGPGRRVGRLAGAEPLGLATLLDTGVALGACLTRVVDTNALRAVEVGAVRPGAV